MRRPDRVFRRDLVERRGTTAALAVAVASSPTRRYIGLLAVAAFASLASCVVSPQPLPPSIDVSKLTVDPTSGTIRIHGNAKAVTGGATLSALAATGTAAATQAHVAADGTFDAVVTPDPANIYRLEASLNGLFSEPVDISVPNVNGFAAGLAEKAAEPYASCLHVQPSPVAVAGDVHLGATTSIAVDLQNGCAQDLAIDDAHLRNGGAGFGLDTAAPLTIPMGQTQAVSLHFKPATASSVDDLLVLHFTGTDPGFVLVTVRGTGIP